jgi:hypothetical protein
MPYKDLQKRREAIQRWKARNKEKVRAQAQAYHKRIYISHPRKLMTEEELKRSKSEQDKRYRTENKTKIARKKACYYQTNKKKILAKYLNELRTNINKRLAHNLRNRITGYFKRDSKSGSAVNDLGCSIQEFKEFVEKKFPPGMSWDNYGDWHLDHIIPLCRFNLSDREQFLKAAHFTNYQPLWAKDNLSKNKYDTRS